MPVKEKTKPARKTKPAKKPAKKNPGCTSGASKPKPSKFKRPNLFEAAKKAAPSTLPMYEQGEPTIAVGKLDPTGPSIFTAPAGLKPHPAADMLPAMNTKEYDALKGRIANEGVLEPITLIEVPVKGKPVLRILDGRHRYQICGELGIDCPATVYTGGVPPYTYVASKAHHRNMDETQKACAAVGLLPKLEEEAKARQVAALKLAGAPVRYQGKSNQEVEDELFKLDDREVADLYRKVTGKDPGDKMPFDQIWGILDTWFPPTPAGKAAQHAAEIFGCGSRYVEMAKALKAADLDLFGQCFAGRDKDGRPLPLSRALAAVNRARNAASQKEAIAAVKAAGIINADDWDIITGDCVEEMNKLEAGSVQLIFADPPYNEGFDYGDDFNDSLPDEMYIARCQEWINAAIRLLSPEGSIFIMCSGKYSSDIESLLKARFLNRRNTIVWHESFGSYTEGNYTNCWRPIHYYSKHPRNFAWHPEHGRVRSWRNENGDTRAVPDGKVPSNVWTEFPRVVGNSAERIAGFPTQLPKALVERIVQMASNPGDLVLDPFNGSGTTGVAAITNSRRYIGIERNPVYAEAARERLSGTTAIL